MTEKPDKWHAVSVTVQPEYVEAVESAFNEMDSLGSEVDLLSAASRELSTVTAYFTDQPEKDIVLAALQASAALRGLSADIDFVFRETVVEDQDWLAEWKKYWKPTELGRFVVAAPWHELADDGRHVIRIEPNMAFGTGTHETTRLCLAAISERYEPSMSFLDVGTGTGILVIAAAQLAAKGPRLVAIDNDPVAVEIARENARLNGVADKIEFSTGSMDIVSDSFDFVCANLTADVIVPLLPALLAAAGKTLVLSGILAEQEQMVTSQIPAAFATSVERDGEWLLVNVEKN